MIRSELDGGVRLLTLDKPDVLNAFNADQFELMAGFERPWWIVGGYAIEAFTGVEREHGMPEA